MSGASEPLIDLSGRRALVTGGSRGIGRSVASALARAGADVGIGYHEDEEAAATAVAALQQTGARAWSQAADLARPEGATQLFLRCDAEFDGLDILVANAGIWPAGDVPVADMPVDDWAEVIAVNLNAVFLTCREAARRIGAGGRIVIVSSTAGQRGEAGHSHYAASKGALIAFTKSLAVELAPRDVTVNAVAPGWVETDMAAPALSDPEKRARVVSEIPLGRVASPGDIAGPILFLCSELARHVTGEVLNINGGSVLCG